MAVELTERAGEFGVRGRVGPDASAWDRLCDRADAPPFLRPGWINAWVECFGRGDLELVEVKSGDELEAVLPMLRDGGTLRSPTNWHSPVFGPVATDGEAREELLRLAFEQPVPVVDLKFLDSDETDITLLERVARSSGRMTVEREIGPSPVITLAGDFGAYEQTLSRNRRKALRRHKRNLEERGEVAFEVHTGRGELEALLKEIFALEASGWKGENGTAISSRPETERFYTEIARWAAQRDWLRLAFLRLDGRPIACDFAIEQGNVWYTLKAGYDEEYRSFGPGALLLRDEIAHCYERGIGRIELLGQEDSFKASWTDRTSPRTWVRAFGTRTGTGLLRWAAIAPWERVRPVLRRARGDG